MGMAASQARLLGITARLHDVEGKAQRVQAQKVALATDQDRVYQTYCDALDKTKIQVAYMADDGSFNYVDGCYDSVCRYKEGRVRQYALQDSQTGKIMLDSDMIKLLKKYSDGKTCGINNSDYMTYYQNMIDAQAKLAEAEAELKKLNSEKPSETITEKGTETKTEDIYETKLNYAGVTAKCTFTGLTIEDHRNADAQKPYGQDFACNPITFTAGSYFDDEASAKQSALDDFENELYSTYPFGDGGYDFVGYTDYTISFDGTPTSEQVKTGTKQTGGSSTKEVVNPAYAEWKNALTALQELVQQRSDEAQAAEDAFENFQVNDPEYIYYMNLWDLVDKNGYEEMKAQYTEGDDGYNWFNNMIEAGLMIIKEYIPTGTKKGWSDTDVTTSVNNNYLQQVEDDVYVKKAEAEYEHALNLINAKDKKYDNELKKLETEEKALTTEIESIEKVRDDNTERTFGIFG